jgi:hypothetical protein
MTDFIVIDASFAFRFLLPHPLQNACQQLVGQ